jgi:hypothetical protein
MKRRRHSPERIVGKLREADALLGAGGQGPGSAVGAEGRGLHFR